jgi:1,4-dihydroxy-2-naphthoyl-CoA hydrolase
MTGITEATPIPGKMQNPNPMSAISSPKGHQSSAEIRGGFGEMMTTEIDGNNPCAAVRHKCRHNSQPFALDAQMTMDPSEWLLLNRVVRFGETDAAGVMHFHHLLRWCHEAYEESLERFGIPPLEIFPAPARLVSMPPVARAGKGLTRDNRMSPAASGSSRRAENPVISLDQPPSVALPIVHCHADYKRPLIIGDHLTIRLVPQQLDQDRFEVTYHFHRGTDSEELGETVARGLTRHRAVDSGSRDARDIPTSIRCWIVASCPKDGDETSLLPH